MGEPALLFTDLEGSTALVERLGDAAAAAMWAEHDRRGRDLIAAHGGQEIDHSDGFFAVFPTVAAAAGFALGYQGGMRTMGLAVRVGIHCGAVTLRHNAPEDVARGAKPVEVEGLAKPLAARVMAHARGGQTLLSAAARMALGAALPAGAALESHGHYRLKGIAEPVELFELGTRGACAFEPPADSEKAYRVVRSGGLWQPLRAVRHNLVADRDAFVGRAAELHALAQRLDAGVRLLTVLGAGGSGKTRLVRRYAWAWLGDWPGGVAFADLSESRSAEGILGAMAAALDLPLSGGDAAAQIGHALAARGRCLVVLDNFEQVLAHAEATLGAWLSRAPEASFVVTSRERLRLQGEEVFALEPLPVAGDAVTLFEVRAGAQQPGFVLSDANRGDVACIVALLDGLPLAIELAAARVRVLSPAQIVARLRDRFALLAGARGVAARQATLRAAIDWSWDLLAPWEQGALAQCAVFDGGFTLEAAEQVLDLSHWPEAPPVLDATQSLVDKSLLRSWVPREQQRYGFEEPYFGMYVSVHEYAAEKLRAQGEDAERAAELRHGRCFAAHGADDAIEALDGPDSLRRRRALALEIDNLVTACRRAVVRADGEIAVATYRAAWEALDLRGPFGLALDLGAQLLDLTALTPAQRARTLAVRSRAAQRAGRMALARDALREAIALAQEAGTERIEAGARSNLGNALRSAGDLDAARAQLETALQMARRLGNQRVEASALSGLGAVLGDQGRTDEALEQYAQSLTVHRAMGNRIDEASVLGLIAVQHAQAGSLAQARVEFEASLAISEALEDRVAIGENLTNLGMLNLDQGHADAGAECYERALVIHREVGNRRFEGYVLGDIGQMHLEQGRLEEARPRLEQALAIARETGERRQQGAVLRYLADLWLKSSRYDAARKAYDDAEALLRALGDKHHLGLLLCGRAELAWVQGRGEDARALLSEARALAHAQQAGPDSQLGRAIQALAATLARAQPE